MDIDKEKFKNVSIDDVSLDFEFRTIRVVFLSSQFDKFEDVLKQLSKDETVFLADNDKFEQFAETLRKLSKRENIRNISSLLSRMVELTEKHLKEGPPPAEKKKSALENAQGDWGKTT